MVLLLVGEFVLFKVVVMLMSKIVDFMLKFNFAYKGI